MELGRSFDELVVEDATPRLRTGVRPRIIRSSSVWRSARPGGHDYGAGRNIDLGDDM